MIIATAVYDSNNTLVTPDEVIPPVFEVDDLTTEAGFWHRYQMSFDSQTARELALDTIQEQLRDFDARPYDIAFETVYPGRNPNYVQAMKDAGKPVPDRDKAYHTLEVLYVIESPEHTPYYRGAKNTPIADDFTMPVDPVVERFIATYDMMPLDLPAQQDARKTLQAAAFKEATRTMQPSTMDNYIETREVNLKMQREKDDLRENARRSSKKRQTYTYAPDPNNNSSNNESVEPPTKIKGLPPKQLRRIENYTASTKKKTNAEIPVFDISF
jgi:hypothetical protein